MKEDLIRTLEPLGFPVILEGTLAPKSYPETFITFWQFNSSNSSFDNDDAVTEWGFNIKLFSTSPTVVEENKKLVLKTLKQSGYIPDGKGFDFAFDSETRHLGWSVDVYFLEVNENG